MPRDRRYGEVARRILALVVTGLAVAGGYLPRPWPLLPRPRSTKGNA
jgi:hypothetical protein